MSSIDGKYQSVAALFVRFCIKIFFRINQLGQLAPRKKTIIGLENCHAQSSSSML